VSRTLFTNVSIFDGSGSPTFGGEVLVEGEKIAEVAAGGALIARQPDTVVINGGGMTLMPGLVEAHGHLSWPCAVDRFIPQFELPLEEQLLATVHNAEVLLDAGFTSVHSAGALGERIEVVVRDQINRGWLRGPRLRASTLERSPPGGEGVETGHVDHGRGPEAMRTFVRHAKDLGVDSIKLVLSGEDALLPGSSHNILYTEDEVRAACEIAREVGLHVVAHTQGAESVKMALRHGVRVLNHCTYADEEALDMMEAARDSIFVVPAIGVIVATLEATPPPHIDMASMKDMAKPVVERARVLIPELRRRGVRVLAGGDYGFPFNPNGLNARDLQHFVDLFGYTPADALVAATRLGGEIMEMPVGEVRAGCLADLLLLDSDPTKDLAVFLRPGGIVSIMKGGAFVKGAKAH